jgi:hypothetical protein
VDALAIGRLGERLGLRALQFRPQAQAAARDPEPPGREFLSKGRHQRVAALGEQAAAFVEDRAARPQQPFRDQLLEHRRRQVDGGAGLGHAARERRRAPDPPQAQPAPECLAHRPHRDDRALAVVRGHRLRPGPPRFQVEPGERLIHDEVGAGPNGLANHRLAFVVRHEEPGRVVEVGLEISDARRLLPERHGHEVEVPPGVRHGRRDEPGPGPPERADGVRIARDLHERRVPGGEQHVEQQRERELRARHDDDLVVGGRDAPRGELLRDLPAERRHPERVVAGSAEVARQVPGGAVDGIHHRAGSRHGRDRQVDRVGRVLAGRQRPQLAVGGAAGGQRDAAPRPLAALQEPLAPEQVVRGRRGGSAHAEHGGELAFRRQPGPQGHPAVQHERTQRPRERRVPGPRALPGPQQPRQLGARDDRTCLHCGHSRTIGYGLSRPL